MAIHTSDESGSQTVYHIDGCAGSGLLGLAIKQVIPTLQTICYIERDSYCASNLVGRMEQSALDHAPIWDDITTAARDRVFVDYIRTFHDHAPLILTAGYPCQPYSLVGKRAGASDERAIWPGIVDLIEVTKPEFLFFENVPGHLTLGFDGVARDLYELGYRVEAGIFSAKECGANHLRERLFIFAMADHLRERLSSSGEYREREVKTYQTRTDIGQDTPPELLHIPLFAPHVHDPLWETLLESHPTLEPCVRRVSDGVAFGLREYNCHVVGNGIFPLAASYAFASLVALAQSD